MGNRTEYILSSMSAPKFDTSAFSSASNQFGNALNVGVRQMDELNKAKSMAYANDYVSNLLGKGDRASVLSAQGMLPYANERYGKQAENLMGDIRHNEQLKQAKDIFDTTNQLEKDKLAEDIRVHNLNDKHQMALLGIQGGQLSEAIRHNKAIEKATSDQYTSALNTKLATPVQAVYAGKDGKINVTTITTKMLLEHPDLYKSLEQYDKMLECTSVMMQPERTNPFPRYVSFIETTMYNDSPSMRVQNLHQIALDKTQDQKINLFSINSDMGKKLFVVDNFYSNPYVIRSFALSQEFKEDVRWYKGLRTTKPFRTNEQKLAFENILGVEITNWEEHGFNGCFQITTAQNPQVYHYDLQKWAGMIYLTPNAPIESGTRLMKSKINGTRHSSEPDVDMAFNGNFYDSTKFEIADSAGNIYNRLVLMDARCIHSAGPYFGATPEDGRLIHLFFFD